MPENRAFRIKEWVVEPDLNTVSRGTESVRIPPKFMQVLVVLASKPGELVTRTKLLEEVWQDTVVVDAVVTRAVSELRKLLDNGDGSEVIETIPKSGYRLVAEVKTVKMKNAVPDSISPSVTDRIRSFGWSGGLPTAAFGLLLAFGWLNLDTTVEHLDFENQRPVTSFQGEEYDPVLSPDGESVAFVMEDKIFLKDVDGPAHRRLTGDSAREFSPAWSPNGESVAYLRCTDGQAEIFMSPVSAPYPESVASLDPAACAQGSRIGWSPNGSALVFADRDATTQGTGIQILDLSDRGRRSITSPTLEFEVHRDPVYSPDGNAIVFAKGADSSNELWIVTPDGSDPEQIVALDGPIEGFDWAPDGSRLVYASRGALWQIDYPGRLQERILAGPSYRAQPAFSKSGSELAFVQSSFDVNLWQIRLSEGQVDGPKTFFASTRIDGDPRISPDGKHVAFISDAEGSCSLWVGHRDGSPARHITPLAETCMRMPATRWSPDGLNLVYSLHAEGNDDVFTVNVSSREVRRITSMESDDQRPSWSGSGKEIYFSSNRTGGWEIWRVSVSGGDPVQISVEGGSSAIESPDGETVFLTKPDTDGVWSVPKSGGQHTLVTADLDARDIWNWRVTRSSLFFVERSEDELPTISRLDLETGQKFIVATLPSKSCLRADIDQAGEWVVFARIDHGGRDIQLAQTQL